MTDKGTKPWVLAVSFAVIGAGVVGAVATVWEFTGHYSHGFVRFVVSSALIGLLAYVMHSKPAVPK